MPFANLETWGVRLVARNYRCRYGEIDLIMQEGATLVFVEVRLRLNPNFAGALFSVNRAKRNRLRERPALSVAAWPVTCRAFRCCRHRRDRTHGVDTPRL